MKGLEGDGAIGVEIRHLAQGVHSGVGAARAGELHRRARQALQGFFQNLLQAEIAPLALPAVVAAAVVFQDQDNIARRHKTARRWQLLSGGKWRKGEKGKRKNKDCPSLRIIN